MKSDTSQAKFMAFSFQDSPALLPGISAGYRQLWWMKQEWE
jgi:hypothetical protein